MCILRPLARQLRTRILRMNDNTRMYASRDKPQPLHLSENSFLFATYSSIRHGTSTSAERTDRVYGAHATRFCSSPRSPRSTRCPTKQRTMTKTTMTTNLLLAASRIPIIFSRCISNLAILLPGRESGFLGFPLNAASAFRIRLSNPASPSNVALALSRASLDQREG